MTTRNAETGNYYYGARYYDPKISVWLSVDPMSAARPNLTPYNFVSNNPIMRIDPTGLLDDWVERDGQIVWDENVTSASDPDLKPGDKYMGKSGSELNEQTGEAVYYHEDGTKTTKTNTLSEVTITPNGGYQTSNPSIGSNNQTGHIYNDRDLAIRSSVLSTDNPIARFLLSQESKGNFGILNGHDYWMTYGHTLGNLMLADQYIQMADMISGGSPGNIRVNKGFNPKPSLSPRPSVPNTFSDYLKTQKGVDVGKYPGRGNWMKQKALEYNRMRR